MILVEGGLIMYGFSIKDRYSFTIDEIESVESDVYESHWGLFNRGVDILKKRLKEEDFSEFSDEERIVLEEIYTYINLSRELEKEK